MLENLNPGDEIRLTVNQEPKAAAKSKTIARLMRRDRGVASSLKRAQVLRRRRMVVYVRGNKDWHQREKSAKVAIVKKGATWVMPFSPELAPDLKSIESYVSIERA